MKDRSDDDDEIARLLRTAGGRDRPASPIAAEVRAAVEAEWREMVSTRQRQRRVTAWAAAAGIAIAAGGVWLATAWLGGSPHTVAALVNTSGTVEGRIDSRHDWTPLVPGAAIASHEQVRTLGSRAAIRLASGIELRLDENSHLVVSDLDEATLETGAAYVDSGAGGSAHAAQFALRTTSGTVRHLGTQYEARLDHERLRVAVREGSVSIETARGTVSGVAGEQILVDHGRVSRRDLPTHDAEWDWVETVVPAYTIEGRPLAEFLRWAARETGRELVFASPAAEREAERIVLRGSIEGLSPDESIDAVRSTTGLAIELDPGRIDVGTPAR